MKILPFRSALAIRATNSVGLSRAISSARRRGEYAACVPGGARAKRHHDVQAFAVGRFQEAREPNAAETLPDEARGVGNAAPLNAGTRVEIEHDAVRSFEVLHDCVPSVNLEDIDLHESDERRKRVDHEVFADLGLLLDLHPSNGVRGRAAAVFLIEALSLSALGTAHQRRRTILQMRQDPLGDSFVKARQVDLGRTVARKKDAVGMREPHAGDDRVGRR
jgi:hypothetical protein